MSSKDRLLLGDYEGDLEVGVGLETDFSFDRSLVRFLVPTKCKHKVLTWACIPRPPSVAERYFKRHQIQEKAKDIGRQDESH